MAKKRLIDANEPIAAFKRYAKEHPNATWGAFGIEEVLNACSTVDAVEVVRCKECKKISPSVTPIKDAVWCREFRAYMPCDGFCSYGERRTNGFEG